MNSFSADITKFVNKANGDMRTVIRRISLEAFSRIVFKTPVDLGAARGNWNTSAGTPDTTYNLQSVDRTGSATLQRAANGLNTWLCEGSMFFVNNLPYIGVLEYGGYPNPPAKPTGKTSGGFSIQAPQGMVRLTVQEMQTWIQEQMK